jgi:protein pelota
MKIIHQDIRHGLVKVRVENLDDLWYLSTLIEPGDLVKGRTIRKIKAEKSDARKTTIKRKPVTIKLQVEKTEFKADLLRILGIITEAPEDVPKGSHHSFNIEINSIIALIKEKWLKFQLDKLKEAAAAEPPKILICIHDREEAIFALSKRKGYEYLSKLKGEVAKKAVESKTKETFYSEIIRQIKEYESRYKVKHIILASPAFWKEESMKQVKEPGLKEKITLATCSSVDKTAVNEVLKRPEIQEIIKQDRIAKEIKLVEELLQEISKNNLASYGIKETELAATAGAVKILLITDAYIQKAREQNKYQALDSIMKTTDKMKGEIHIIGSEHEGGKKLDGLGGIAAILRYKIT